jgi:CHAD domain-containing protein
MRETVRPGGNGSADEAAVHPDRVRDILASIGRKAIKARRQILRGKDGEAIHDLRVATRRLQAALEVFASCLPERRRRLLEKRARKIRRGLGARRNAWVLVRLLGRSRAGLGPDEKKFVNHLALRLKRSAGPVGPTKGKRLPGLRGRLEKLFRDTAACVVGPRGPVLSGLADAVLAARGAARGAGPEAMHRLRIAIKRYRYALEVLAEAGSPGLDAAIRGARALQRELGRLHDLDVLIEVVGHHLRERGAAPFLRRVVDRRGRQAARTLRLLDGFTPAGATRSGRAGRPRRAAPAAAVIGGTAA